MVIQHCETFSLYGKAVVTLGCGSSRGKIDHNRGSSHQRIGEKPAVNLCRAGRLAAA